MRFRDDLVVALAHPEVASAPTCVGENQTLSGYSERIAALEAVIRDLQAQAQALRDQEHERGEMIRTEQHLRDGIIELRTSERFLAYQDGRFVVREQVRRGKLRGTWPVIFAGNFPEAYAAFRAERETT